MGRHRSEPLPAELADLLQGRAPGGWRCGNCGPCDAETPMRRRGPGGPSTLCNAYGLMYSSRGVLCTLQGQAPTADPQVTVTWRLSQAFTNLQTGLAPTNTFTGVHHLQQASRLTAAVPCAQDQELQAVVPMQEGPPCTRVLSFYCGFGGTSANVIAACLPATVTASPVAAL